MAAELNVLVGDWSLVTQTQSLILSLGERHYSLGEIRVTLTGLGIYELHGQKY